MYGCGIPPLSLRTHALYFHKTRVWGIRLSVIVRIVAILAFTTRYEDGEWTIIGGPIRRMGPIKYVSTWES